MPAAAVTVTAAPADMTTYKELKLDAASIQANVQSYALGVPPAAGVTGDTTSANAFIANASNTAGVLVGMPIAGAGIKANTTVVSVGSNTITMSNTAGATAPGVALTFGPLAAPGTGAAGLDGAPPDDQALIGAPFLKTGLFALDSVDLFNLLCLPRTAALDPQGPAPLTPAQSEAVIAAVINYCAGRRAFFLADTPDDITTYQRVQDDVAGNAALQTANGANAAICFPRVQVPDPLNQSRLRSVGASGTMGGVYAGIDADRGVWKAAAGTEASLVNVQQLDVRLTDAENGVLNPLGINCLRTFPVYGSVAWGARTLQGNDQIGSQWKYVPVRRLALYLEESLYRGLKWVVFEPNDAPLWAQIRFNVGEFMQTLFLKGAFQGASPRQAYLVKCDGETTTQDDIDHGVVNVLVGFAPLRPAECVILRIQQLAGQSA